MLTGDLFDRAGLVCPEQYRNIEVSRIVSDSTCACEGCMFLSLAGHNTGGHGHIEEAIKNGAAVIVAEQVCDECVGGAAIIIIDNTRRAAALLYNVQYGEPTKKLKIIGVTGTNGKTSVCACLDKVFSFAKKRCGVIGTLGSYALGVRLEEYSSGMTTPEPSELYAILSKMVEMGVEYVFMEISSHALAQGRADAIEPEWAVFTNLTRDHLDYHKNMEEYFSAKSKLFAMSKRAMINADDEYGKRLLKQRRDALSYSLHSGDATAKDVSLDKSGAKYTLSFRGGDIPVRVGALGEFSVMNSLAAAAVAMELGVSPEEIRGGLLRFFGAKGRMERITPDMPFEVIVDYAHTPDALEKAILSARRSLCDGGRMITLFGCGGDRDKGKRRQMAQIASRLSSFVIVTSDNPRSEDPRKIIADIMKGIDKERAHTVIVSRREAIRYAVSVARPGDVVLLAGKGHEKYEIDANGKHPFDEEKIVAEALAIKKRGE